MVSLFFPEKKKLMLFYNPTSYWPIPINCWM